MAASHINEVIAGDCRDLMQGLSANCISTCITDPPYNYEFVGRDWNYAEVERRLQRVNSQTSSTLVKNIPYGSGLAGGVRNKKWYARARQNIVDYEEWCFSWAEQLFRVCKPGATVACFNSTRTVAHVQVALERAGFYARDTLVYRRSSGIPKGYNAEQQLKKMSSQLAREWAGWHSCLRNEWEAIVVLQKPLQNNYTETLTEHGTGLFYAANEDGSFTSNILENLPRDRAEEFNVHCTVKPLSLMRRLVEIFAPPGLNSVVLDPFAGSGTTLVAAKELGRSFLGFEMVPEYVQVAKERLARANGGKAELTLGKTRGLPLFG